MLTYSGCLLQSYKSVLPNILVVMYRRLLLGIVEGYHPKTQITNVYGVQIRGSVLLGQGVTPPFS